MEKGITHSNSHPTTSILIYIEVSKLVIKSTGDVVFMGERVDEELASLAKTPLPSVWKIFIIG